MLYLVVILNIVVHSCYAGSRVVVALYAISLGANPLMIGTMVALYTIPPWLLGLYAGRASDRFGPRRPMLFGAALTGLGLLVPYFWQALPALYVSAALLGIAFVFYNVSVQNLAGAIGGREQRAKNFSALSMGYSISSLIGPLVAGYSIEYLSHRAAFLAFAVSTVVPVVVLWLYRPLADIVMPKTDEGRRSALELLRMPELRRTLILGAMVVTGWDLFLFYMPIYGHDIGMTESRIGIVVALFAAGTFVVRFFMPWLVKRFSSRHTIAGSMVTGALMFLVIPFVVHPVALGVLAFVCGLGLGCGQPLTLMLSYNRSPPGRTGEVTGLRLSLNHATHSSVPLAAGAIGAAFGAAPPFLMIAVILAASAWLATKVTPLTQLQSVPEADEPK